MLPTLKVLNLNTAGRDVYASEFLVIEHFRAVEQCAHAFLVTQLRQELDRIIIDNSPVMVLLSGGVWVGLVPRARIFLALL